MEMPKSPRTVLITGSGRGIGAAAAKKFWEAGDRVVLNALHPENIGVNIDTTYSGISKDV